MAAENRRAVRRGVRGRGRFNEAAAHGRGKRNHSASVTGRVAVLQ